MGGQIPYFNPAVTSTTQQHDLGSMHIDYLGRFWQYVKGGGTLAQYEFCQISTDGNYTIVSTNDTSVPSAKVMNIGCVQVSGGFTSTKYGWIFRGNGAFTGLIAASCVQDVKLLTTNTNGVLDDSGTTAVLGVKLLTTIVGAAASACWANTLMTTNP
jgi:hypothetical protein